MDNNLKTKKVPQATVARLPIYMRCLSEMLGRDCRLVSSDQLAAAAGTNAAQVRKDFSYLGEFGTRGVGYDTEHLTFHIGRFLGLGRERKIAIVGAGNLGSALTNYRGFHEKSFKVVLVFDRDLRKIGKKVGQHTVHNVADLPAVVRKKGGIDIGVITTPAAEAQRAADLLVSANVKGILNFAPTSVEVPPDVQVRQVDLSVELQIMCFHLSDYK